MTWTRFLETGSGSIAVRLVIEGLAVEFVSEPGMELTTADGRRRVYCLDAMKSGLTIEDRVVIQEAKLEAQGMSLRLFETQDEDIASVLAFRPDEEWWVSATVEIADGSVLLLGTSGLAVDDVVHLGTEAMKVTLVGAGTITVDRAHWNTIAQKHWSNETALEIPYRTLSNRPMRIRGRRAYLHVYSDGDPLTGDGTQIWIGHVTSEPRLAGGIDWSLQLGSIAERLDARFGGELEYPAKPRGIYYSARAALRVAIQEQTASARNTLSAPFVGFFEDQVAFCTALTSWLATEATAAGLASTYRAVPNDSRWDLTVEVGTGVTGITFLTQSIQDGETHPNENELTDLSTGLSTGGGTIVVGSWYAARWIDGPFADARMVPRGVFGDPERLSLQSPSDIPTYPDRRVYLGSAVDTDWSAVLVEWASTITTREAHSMEYAIDGDDTSDNWILLRNYGHWYDDPPTRYGAWTEAALRPVRQLAVGNLADLRDVLVSDGPEFCNRGTAPFLTSADLADWTDVVTSAVRGRRFVDERRWTATTPADVIEVLSAEMLLLGVFPIIDSDGKIGLAELELPQADGSETVIDDEIITVDWSSMYGGGQTINRVVVKTGYDAIEDDWLGTVYNVRNEDAYASDHVDRAITIEPRSYSPRGVDYRPPDRTTQDDITTAVMPIIGVFGYPHDIITVHVSWKLFGLRCGDTVLFSADHLPDPAAGTRPLTDALAIVVGRRWVIGEAHGTLELLMPQQVARGYAPTARVTSQADKGGNLWELTVDSTMHAPAGTATDTFFAADDVVRIVEYDSESPTVVTGTVTFVNTVSHVIGVQFDGVWTPPAVSELCFDNYANVVDDQKLTFAFIADSTMLLGTDRPHKFAP